MLKHLQQNYFRKKSFSFLNYRLQKLNEIIFFSIGLYRLCGSATKKRILREAFERNARSVDLSPDNVPDINVITGNEVLITENCM